MHFRYFLLLASLGPLAASLPAATSPLWGQQGEAWYPAGRLPDFSFAGFERGEKPLPRLAVRANVRDFGAKGDGKTDDTRAIQAAVDATPEGAILLPPGRYVITDYIRITKSGVVLRGAGADHTVLWFPKGLDEVHPREMRESRGLPTSGYSFDGAFVTLEGDYQATPLAQVTAPTARGAQEVTVDRPDSLRVGQDVLLVLREDDRHSLKTHLYSDDPGDLSKAKPLRTRMLLRVVAIDGSRVRFDRPLRFDTRPEWQPQLCAFNPTVSHSGVESLTFEFPNTKYRGHFNENGANALELKQVAHCWVRDVRIHNADMGVNLLGLHNTIDGGVFTADPERETTDSGAPDCTGHHAFQIKRGEDNLITRFDIRTCFIHELTVENASGNVYADGRGRDLAFDHHKDTPYENLFTAIHCGRGQRIWISGGGAGLGRHCAGYGTFWNIKASKPLSPPPRDWGPKTMTFVGMASSRPSDTSGDGPWWESATDLEPVDLHRAQLAHRLAAPR